MTSFTTKIEEKEEKVSIGLQDYLNNPLHQVLSEKTTERTTIREEGGGIGGGIGSGGITTTKKHASIRHARIRHYIMEQYFVRNVEQWPHWDDVVDSLIHKLIDFAKPSSSSSSSNVNVNANANDNNNNNNDNVNNISSGTVLITNEELMTASSSSSSIRNDKKIIDTINNNNNNNNTTIIGGEKNDIGVGKGKYRWPRPQRYWYEGYEWNEELIQQVSRIHNLNTVDILTLFESSSQSQSQLQPQTHKHTHDNNNNNHNNHNLVMEQFYKVVHSVSKHQSGHTDSESKPKYMQFEFNTSSAPMDHNDIMAMFCDILKDVTIQLLKSKHLVEHHPMIYMPRSLTHVKFDLVSAELAHELANSSYGLLDLADCKITDNNMKEWLEGFEWKFEGQMTLSELGDERYLCTGCGREIFHTQGNSSKRYPVYMALSAHVQFIFHDKQCVKLRKLKEAIRLFVFYVEVSKQIPNYRPPETLAEQILQFFKMKGAVISLSQAKPLPLPTPPEKKEANIVREVVSMFDKNRADKQRALKFTRERKVTALRLSRREQFRNHYRLKAERKEHRPMGLNTKENTLERTKGADGALLLTKIRSRPIIPRLLYELDVYTYGKSLWYFCVHQLEVKDRESVWDCLTYLATQLPTPIAVRLLEENREQLSKLHMKSLDDLCRAIIETSEFPEAVALYLAAFMKERAHSDLSRQELFDEIAEKYIEISTELLSQIESDHLLAILLEIPCDIDHMSILDIALRFHLDTFLDFHRVAPLMLQMWHCYEYLDPKENFVQIEKSNFEILGKLITSPNRFYFSAIGKYLTQFFLYFFYVLYVSWFTYLRVYPFENFTLQEIVLWLANCGFILFQLAQFVIEGRNYFANLLNYCDMAIVWVWITLFIMRFLIPREDHPLDSLDVTETSVVHEFWTLRFENRINTDYSTTYMLFWSVQCILLWVRVAGFFRRNNSTGVFLKMAMKMMTEILNFLVLLILFTAGFMLALYYIVAGDLRITRPDICTYDGQFRYELFTLYQSVIYIFQTLLGEQDWTTINERFNPNTGVICFGAYRSRLAQSVIILYSVVGTIILLNLLLALIATTFDALRERARVESNFSRFQDTVDTATRHALMSPPFNLIVVALMAILTVVDSFIRFITGGRYVLNAEQWFPVNYSLKNELMIAKMRNWRRGQRSQQMSSHSELANKSNLEMEIEMKNITKDTKDKQVNTTQETLLSKEEPMKLKSEHDMEPSLTSQSQIIPGPTAPKLKWYQKLFIPLDERKCFESPFRDPVYCRYCRHFIGDAKGDINDYFELFQEYQIIDEADKELMKKLLYRRTICPICFRPFTEGSKYHRWQVMLEVLSFYVFMLFIWLPLIILLFIPALLDRFWSNIKALRKPQSETTDALINADIDLENIDFEYKEVVRSVMAKTRTESDEENLGIDMCVLEEEMSPDDY